VPNSADDGKWLPAVRDALANEEVESPILALPPQRQEAIVTLRRKVREYDFRDRVLRAYGHECAMCGYQLGLVEAAHIIPVADPGSHDETRNGVALCSLHHRAYDTALLGINGRYEVLLNKPVLRKLTDEHRGGGVDHFQQGLRKRIVLPAAAAEIPRPADLERALMLRGWRAS
jgi:putative restriction endonuclease